MGLNILIADDSAIMRKMITKVLRLSGLPLGEVYEAGDGVEALEVLDSQYVDLALVDINMPVMNGEELIAQVRSIPETEHLPVIVVSSEGSETRIQSLRQKGAEFVHKPFSPETIRQMVIEITGVSNEQAQTSDIQSCSADF